MDSTSSTSKGGVTFTVSTKKLQPPQPYENFQTIAELMKYHPLVSRRKGELLLATQSNPRTKGPLCGNGFVGTCLKAYNEHYHLKLSPDQVWIAIATALANYIDKHSEEMRHLFVDHEGQREITVFGGGNVKSANYDALIAQISNEVDKNTKDDLRSWLECDFTTSTPLSRTVSKLVLMGAMKNYFAYKMCLMCGLPKVTLEGTLDDWRSVRTRVDRLSTWKVPVLTSWSQVLGYVLDHFVSAFEAVAGNHPVDDPDFWNRIAHESGGGSGPTYLNGWVLAFAPFTNSGQYVLRDLESIKKDKKFGKMDTDDIPPTAVEVPVTIDDNGTVYKTIFYAGVLATVVEDDLVQPTLDWALVDVTNAVPVK